jgi:hypothetical protein
MDTLRKTILLLILLLLVATGGSAQQTGQTANPQEMEIVRDWWGSGTTRIRLESQEDSSNVKSVYINTKYDRHGWLTQIEGEAHADGNAKVEVGTHKTIFGSTRTFAKWKHKPGDDALETGLEVLLFGTDKLKLSHQLQPLSNNLEARTELSYKRSLWGANSLKLTGTKNSEQDEIGGEFLHEEKSGLMWGASLKTQKSNSQGGWGRPQIQGKVRWTW